MALRQWIAGAATATASVFMAGGALALSCLPPTIEGSYQQWSDSPDRYYLVSGNLTPLSPVPQVPSPGSLSAGMQAPDLRAVYRIEGEVLYAEQAVPIDHVIWVRVNCAGPWCAGFPDEGTTGVMALRQLPDYTLELGMNPCGGDIFRDPSGAVKARVRQCQTTGCAPAVPGRQ